MKKLPQSLIVICLLSTLVCACYQTQSEDDLRTIPTTNNPNVVPENHGSPMPKAGF